MSAFPAEPRPDPSPPPPPAPAGRKPAGDHLAAVARLVRERPAAAVAVAAAAGAVVGWLAKR